MKFILRSLIFLHRWVGIALCVVFLFWFPSGIGMMYWGFPGVAAGDRLEHSPKLDPAKIVLSPEEAAEKAGTQANPTQIRLNSFDGRPVYRVGGGGGRGGGGGGGRGGPKIIYADTGDEQTEVSTEMLDRIATTWSGRPLGEATKISVEEIDQWTVAGGLASLRPMYKYTWPDGQQVYVNGTTGEVVQYTTFWTRVAAHVSAIPHWLYYTPLRKHQPFWLSFMIYSSLIGTIGAILGIVVAVWMYSPQKRYRLAGQPTGIPYRGQKRWHWILGIVFGVATVTWTFSGLMTLGPFPIVQRLTQPAAQGQRGAPQGQRQGQQQAGDGQPQQQQAAAAAQGEGAGAGQPPAAPEARAENPPQASPNAANQTAAAAAEGQQTPSAAGENRAQGEGRRRDGGSSSRGRGGNRGSGGTRQGQEDAVQAAANAGQGSLPAPRRDRAAAAVVTSENPEGSAAGDTVDARTQQTPSSRADAQEPRENRGRGESAANEGRGQGAENQAAGAGSAAAGAPESGAGNGGGRGGGGQQGIAGALRGRIRMTDFASVHPRDLLAKVPDLDVRELTWTSYNSRPVFNASLGDGKSQLLALDASRIDGFDTEEVIGIVKGAIPDQSTIQKIEIMDQYDLYYLDRTRQRPLPVIRVLMNDEARTRYYVDPKSAQVVTTYSNRNWVNRWLYNGLHSLNFPFLYNHRPLWDIVVITFMVGGTALCVTSLVLAWRTLGRKLKRVAANDLLPFG